MKVLIIALILLNSVYFSQTFFEKTNCPHKEGTVFSTIAISSSGDIFVGNPVGSIRGNDGYILKSNDNGDNWEIINNNIGISCLLISANNDIFAGTFEWPYGGNLLRSKDNGYSWARIIENGGALGDIRSLQTDSKGRIFLQTGRDISYANDDGKNWFDIHMSFSNEDFRFEILSFTKSQTENIFIGGHSGQIYRTSNWGTSWQQLENFTDGDINSLMIDSYGYVHAGTTSGFYTSMDNGNNWTMVNDGLLGLCITSLAIDSDNNIIAGIMNCIDSEANGYSIQKLIFSSKTWEEMVNPGDINSRVCSIAITPKGDIFVATANGIYRHNANLASNGEEIALPKQFTLEQNYPNPFNPSTTIKYSVSRLSKVTLKVFDMLGCELVTIVNKEQSQGNYEFEFDGNELTSGIYFFRLKADDFVEMMFRSSSKFV